MTVPGESRSVVDDVRHFFLHRPENATHLDTSTEAERGEVADQIVQRIGIDISSFSVVNVHRIGIDAPVGLVFEEILRWSGRSPAWPNHVATVEGLDEGRRRVRIVLFGDPSGARRGRLYRVGARFRTLFNMRLVDVHREPTGADVDNARHLLWECRGGYPIGVFAIYARSAIAARGESESTQLFFAVGFNPYGSRLLSTIHPVRRLWEIVHNRVTANVLNRFKALCEVRFVELQAGATSTPG
jgi:hypothetical protein